MINSKRPIKQAYNSYCPAFGFFYKINELISCGKIIANILNYCHSLAFFYFVAAENKNRFLAFVRRIGRYYFFLRLDHAAVTNQSERQRKSITANWSAAKNINLVKHWQKLIF